MKKTKIVCTIGPASDEEKILTHLIASGMNVARLNFSHGSHEEQQLRVDKVKKIRNKLDTPIAILLDTKGPEIRITQFEEGAVLLREGAYFTLKGDDSLGNEEGISITYKNLAKEVKKSDVILIDDGLIRLSVREIKGDDVVCMVENGGELKNNKSINIPGVNIKLPALTKKDIDDLKFGIKNEVDYIAASFVRNKEDVLGIRKVLEENGGENIHIISKIENRQGVDNIDEILLVSDGIMVARGDLGVEIPPEEVPIVQKDIIRKCNKIGKPVITATQMLDSMIKNPRATRAEVADVANAIFDGTDAIMLSGETAAGKYPIESVQTMGLIAEKAEANLEYDGHFTNNFDSLIGDNNITNCISFASCSTGKSLNAKAIITPTGSGYTAKMISKFRPSCDIIAYTDKDYVQRRLSLVWGVNSLKAESFSDIETTYKEVITLSLENNILQEGDLVIITAGLPLGNRGTTNAIRVETVGQHVLIGKGIGTKRKKGIFRLYEDKKDFIFEDGDILGVSLYTPSLNEYIKRAGGVVTLEHGLSCDTAVVSVNYDISVLVGVDNFEGYKSGDKVTIDPFRGLVYKTK